MHHLITVLIVAAVAHAASFANAGANSKSSGQQVFHSQIHSDTKLRYVANSGICETTPGVNQYSGYFDLGQNNSMWFWFFEARNSPETAPLTLWLDGGPGCSSMGGLFQANGPCQVNEHGNKTYNNTYSWNSVSNMIYIDQPIGTGFSYGTATINSTESAAPFVWKAFQIFFESELFSKYANRELILATESYGGHYGPSFVTYFNEQNALIARGAIEGKPIIVNALMINNGWYDPLIQNVAYYKFASYAPGYGRLQPNDVLHDMFDALYGSNGCVAQEETCYLARNTTASNRICSRADGYCGKVYDLAVQDRDPNDLRQQPLALFPPKYYVDYLRIPEVVHKIGAKTDYSHCSFLPFGRTGDNARTSLPELSALANSKLRILIWAGDADINCNWIGAYDSVLAMRWYGNETFHNTTLRNMTLDGTAIAAVANVDNFSFARVYGAGHKLSAFKPAEALEIFKQVIKKEPLHSVQGSG